MIGKTVFSDDTCSFDFFLLFFSNKESQSTRLGAGRLHAQSQRDCFDSLTAVVHDRLQVVLCVEVVSAILYLKVVFEAWHHILWSVLEVKQSGRGIPHIFFFLQ